MRRTEVKVTLMVGLVMGLGLVAERAFAKEFVVVTPSARGRRASRLASTTAGSIVESLRAKGVAVRAVTGRRAGRIRRCLARVRCARRLVRRLDAEMVLTGSVRHYRGRYVMALDAFDGQTARRSSRERARGRRPSQLTQKGVRFAISLMRQPDLVTSQNASAPLLSDVSQATDAEEPPIR